MPARRPLPDRAARAARSATRQGGPPTDRNGQAGRVVPRRAAFLTTLAAVGCWVAACGISDNPANDFCSSYGNAMHGVVSAAHQYAGDTATFSAIYKSTLDSLPAIRDKAPDDALRSAFDRSMFTFSVFSNDADLANFITRVDFANDAVILSCGDHGIDVRV